jgi:hypothetical protein
VEETKDGETAMRAALLVIGLLLISSQMVSAFTVSPLVIDPAASLPPCTLVNISFTIDNQQPDANDFPDAVDLEMFSELYSSTWSLTLLKDKGQKILPVRGDHVSLSGWNLSGVSLNASHEMIQVVLSGYVPRVTQTGKKTIISQYQTDKYNKPLDGSYRSIQPIVINTCCVDSCNPGSYTASLSNLKAFRSHIDEFAVKGIDTSSSEEKYNLSQQKIASAGIRPMSQYAEARNDLEAARTAIDEGERLLDKAWAEREIADAQEQMDKTDAIIGWFEGNQSTANLVGLQPILLKHQQTTNYLSMANGEFAAGNYSSARSDATLAYTSANESYNDAVRFRYGLLCCDSYVGPYSTTGTERLVLFTGAGIIIIILFTIGIVLWKKR